MKKISRGEFGKGRSLYNICLIIIVNFLLLFNSCGKTDNFNPRYDKPVEGGGNEPSDDTTMTVEKQNKYIDSWIMLNMREYYLWNEELPTDVDSTLSPAKFYQSILYNYGSVEGDRFSQIINLTDVKSLTAAPMAGYDFVLLGSSGAQSIYGFINYVDKNSPAAIAGLKRGDLILRINGVQLTRSNYTSLTNQTTTDHVITLGEVTENNSLVAKEDLNISVAYYEDSPIFLDTVFNIGGKKIAYLVYNSFMPDTDDGTKIDRELNSIFGKFKSQGATELVLDLRFNGGGALNAATNLASMIVPATYKGRIFTKRQYNNILHQKYLKEHGSDYFYDKFVSNVSGESVQNLGVNRLYVLVSYRTASASEVVINGLKSYMDVVTIGRDKTVGKNVGSIRITTDDKLINWELQPIVVRLSNNDGFSDYSSGFTPDYYENEYDIKNPYQLGDIREKLLFKAINLITGQNATVSHDIINNNIETISSSELILHPEKQQLFVD